MIKLNIGMHGEGHNINYIVVTEDYLQVHCNKF